MADFSGNEHELAPAPWCDRLSREQLRFYFLHQVNPNSPEVYLTQVIKLSGSLDSALLSHCYRELIAAEPMLRAVFPARDGSPIIAVRPTSDARLLSLDLSLLAPEARARKVEELTQDEIHAREAFSLEHGPLVKAQLLRLSEREHVMIIRFHHIISDGWSNQLVVSRLLAAYDEAGRGTRAEATPAEDGAEIVHYDEFIRAEASQLEGESYQSQFDYWKNKLAGAPDSQLLTDHPRPEVHTLASRCHSVRIPQELTEAVLASCRAHGITPYIYLLTCFQVLLHRAGGQQDIVVGSPVSSRTSPEFRNVLGLMVNWLVFRSRILPEQPFEQVLKSVATDAIESYENQNLPLQALFQAAKQGKRDASRNPLFQVIFNFVQKPALPQPQGLAVSSEDVFWPQTHFDLAVMLVQEKSGFQLSFVYYADLFDAPTIEALATEYQEILRHYLTRATEPLNQRPKVGRLAQFGQAVAPARAAQAAPNQKFVITATFTPEPVEPVLAFWLNEVKCPMAVEFAPLDQVFQEVLNPASQLRSNASGVGALLLRFEDWKDPRAQVQELVPLLQANLGGSPSPTIVAVCPPTRGWRENPARMALQRELEEDLAAALEKETNLHFVSWREILATYPVADFDDPDADAYGKVPYTPEFYAALATAIARKTHALKRPAPKVLVLDCDNTLWTGVVGEDGVEGIVIDAGRRRLQEFAVAQAKAGVLICLCSKNNEPDVWEVFDSRSDMILKKEHIVAWRINWDPKSANLRSMAQELNLGIDSFVFLDDSPVECAEVGKNCPEALALQVPAASADLPALLDHLWLLDLRKVTDADRKRTQMYQENAQRERVRKTTSGLQDFIASLGLKVGLASVDKENSARVSQMTQRTNQFNVSTIRRTEGEVLALCGDEGMRSLVVDVSDRFGDYGIVGLVLFKPENGALLVDTFLLSCRALGRAVEQRMLHALGGACRKEGLSELRIPFVTTKKNGPARQFLDGISGARCEKSDQEGAFVYRVPVEVALDALNHESKVEEIKEESKAAPAAAPAARLEAAHWLRLSRQLSTVSAIIAASRPEGRQRSATDIVVPPRSELERRLFGIWQEVLGVAEFGIQDSYFALGGDSILSLRVVSQIKKLGFQLSPLDVHQYPTIERLAVFLEAQGERKGTEAAPRAASEPAPEYAREYPLSSPQEFMVKYYDRNNRGEACFRTCAYHFQQAIKFEDRAGPLDVDAFAKAIELLSAKHPVLHTYLMRDGAGLRQAVRPGVGIKPHRIDLTGLSESEQDRRFEDLLVEDRARPFDPFDRHGEIIRYYLFVRSATRLDYLVCAHHAFGDGWGYQEFLNQLIDLYGALKDGDRERLAEAEREAAQPRNVYAEYVRLNQRDRESQEMAGFWRPRADLHRTSSAARPRQPVSSAAPGEETVESTFLDRHTWQGVLEATRAHGVQAKTILLAAFGSLLAREAGQERSSVAVVASGRSDELSDPLKSFGLFWNFTPVSVPTASGDPRGMAALQAELTGVEKHSRFPLEVAAGGEEGVDRLAGSFNFIHFHNANWTDSGRRLAVVGLRTFDKFHFPVNLKVTVSSRQEQVELTFTWDQSRYDRETIRRLARQYTGAVAELLRGLGSAEAVSSLTG